MVGRHWRFASRADASRFGMSARQASALFRSPDRALNSERIHRSGTSLRAQPAASPPVSVRNWPAFPGFRVECLNGRLRAQPEPLPGGQPATSFPIGRNRALKDYGVAFRWRAPRFEAVTDCVTRTLRRAGRDCQGGVVRVGGRPLGSAGGDGVLWRQNRAGIAGSTPAGCSPRPRLENGSEGFALPGTDIRDLD